MSSLTPKTYVMALTAQEIEQRLLSIDNLLPKSVIRQSLSNPAVDTVPSTQAVVDALTPIQNSISGLGGLADNDSVALDSNETSGILPVAKGGTGGSSVSDAQQNLGILTQVEIQTLINNSIPSIQQVWLDSAQVLGVLPVAKGGTGSSSPSQALKNLGIHDSNGKVPVAQLPAVAITGTFPVSSQSDMLALDAQTGDVAIRSDISKSFILMQEPPSQLANWKELLNDAEVKLTPQIRGALRRSYSEAGYTLVVGSFEQGGSVTASSDVLLFEADGGAYQWAGSFPVGGKVVPPGSTPTTAGGVSPSGWISRDTNTLHGNLIDATGASLVGTQSGLNLAEYLLKGAGINPDMFTGPLSDAGRVQAAIDLWENDKTKYVALPRAYDVTGATLRVANVETESPERSLVIIGGELIKLDAGNMFDKPLTGQTLATSEVRFIGTKFRGPNATGTYIINGHNDLNGAYDSAHMIRVSFVGCFGTGIQVAYAKPTGYLQSITMDANCIWRKWSGYLFDCGWMYDVQCFNPRLEAGDAVWNTRDVNADPACSGCNFSGGNVEGLSGASGPAFDVGVCLGTTISPAYMEANRGGDIDCSKGVGFHKGLTIMSVKMEPTTTQAADPNYYSVRLGKGAEGAFNLGGNFSTSNLYECSAGNQAVVADHSSFVAAGKKLFGPNVLRRFEPTGVGFHGQLADGFGVGAMYEYGLFYVDGAGSDPKRYTGFGDAAPTAISHPSITFGRGSMIFNRSAGLQDRQYGSGTVRSALIQGWQCVASGAPGVWHEVAVMMPY